MTEFVMIWTLIEKEARDQILSIRFTISLMLGLLFLVPSTYMLASEYGQLRRELGPRGKIGSDGGPWYYLYRDVPALQVLATGLDTELSLQSVSMVTTGPQFGEDQFVQNPIRYLFSKLDFVFYINIVGSLMAFAFTYDAISGERERGTLRLTHNCEELIEMIQNLLDLHSVQQESLRIQPARLGVGAVIREVLDHPPALLEKRGLQLRRDLRDTNTPVSVDSALMGRVFANILKAAAKLTAQQGQVKLTARRRGNRVDIRVETGGSSITPDQIPFLLDQYAHDKWRSLGLDAGLGIGLNFGKLLVEAHGGRFRIEAGPDHSAAFVVELPVASDS